MQTQMIEQEVYIPQNHQLKIKVPDTISVGKKEVFMIFKEKEMPIERVFGSAKNELKLKDDFNDELPNEIIESFYK